MDLTPSTLGIIARLTLAIVFGAIVGWERELKGRPAGLRTHMLVALGAAGFTLVAVELLGTIIPGEEEVRVDPLRIVAAVVGGGWVPGGWRDHSVTRPGQRLDGPPRASGWSPRWASRRDLACTCLRACW